MPPDPKPVFIYPGFVVAIQQRCLRGYHLHIIAALLLTLTIGLLLLLRRVPLLQESTLSVLIAALEQVLPSPWSTMLAVLYGIAIMMLLGNIVCTTPPQKRLDEMPIQQALDFC